MLFIVTVTLSETYVVESEQRNSNLGNFSNAFNWLHREKIEIILAAYNLQIIISIMLLYKIVKVIVRSPDRDTDFFSIVDGFFKGDILAPYLFIIYQDYIQKKYKHEFKKMESSPLLAASL